MIDGAVVVLYNPENSDYEHILDYAGKVDRTLIIDNSKDSHLTQISNYMTVDDQKMIYWHFPENIGLCKGMNKGVLHLKELGCNWVLTMNSDSFYQNDILSVFRNYVKNNNCYNVAILSPQFNYDRHQVKPYKGTKSVSWVMMSGNYVNTEIFEKLGGFLEEFFVDGLDIEYCLWAKKGGYEIIECGEAILEHMPALTREFKVFGKTVLRYGISSPNRYYYQSKSLVYIIKKYKSLHELILYLYKFFKIITFFDNKKEYLKEFHRGTKDGRRMIGRKNW